MSIALRCRGALVAAAALCAGQALAAEPFVGRWAVDPQACVQEGDTSETMPLIIGRGTIVWFVASCSYRSAAQRDDGWHINARCTAEGEVKRIRIVVRRHGDWLTVRWGDSKPTKMRRCR